MKQDEVNPLPWLPAAHDRGPIYQRAEWVSLPCSTEWATDSVSC